MRWDGTLGFPGGYIEDDETVAEGLNREMAEEMNVKSKYLTVTDRDFMMAHLTSKFSYYLYVKEVSEDLFKSLEINTLKARDFGTEVGTGMQKSIL